MSSIYYSIQDPFIKEMSIQFLQSLTNGTKALPVASIT